MCFIGGRGKERIKFYSAGPPRILLDHGKQVFGSQHERRERERLRAPAQWWKGRGGGKQSTFTQGKAAPV
jgi:hypothetical protein